MILFACVFGSAGQAVGLQPELDVSSPRATFQTFQAEMDRIEGLYRAYLAAPTRANRTDLMDAFRRLGTELFDLRGLPRATRQKHGTASIGYLSDILHRLPEVPADAFPPDPAEPGAAPPAHWTLPGSEIRIERVTEGAHAGEYLFSRETVERLPEWHAEAMHLPVLRPGKLANVRHEQVHFVGPTLSRIQLFSMPEALERPFLEVPAWKAILVPLVSGSLLLIVVVWSRFVRRLSAHLAVWQRYGLWLTAPGVLALLTWLSHSFFANEAVLYGPLALIEEVGTVVLLYVAAAWASWISCWFLVELVIASPFIPDQSYDAHLLRMLARVISMLSAGGLLIYGANEVGVPALGLLAGVSIGGLALALAAQTTVENLIGGVTIFTDRPFRVGEFIGYGDKVGTVEAIGPRSTRVRGLNGTLTTVPNADLAKKELINFTKRDKNLFHHQIGVRYETSPAQLEWLLKELRTRVSAHPLVEKEGRLPRVCVVGFGASSIDIEIFAKVLTPDFGHFLEIQQDLAIEVMKAVVESGTGFAFPSRTTYLARDGGLDAAATQRAEQAVARNHAKGATPEPPEPDHVDALRARSLMTAPASPN